MGSHSPTWTGDGREIIFAAGGLGVSNLYRIAVSGSEGPRRVMEGVEKAYYPSIAPNGNRLAFAKAPSPIDIWRISLQKSMSEENPPERILYSSRNEDYPKYSHDGTHIAFQSDRGRSLGIWVSDSNGSNVTEVFSPGIGRSSGAARWSPDSQRLVFNSNHTGKGELAAYAVGATGGTPVRLTFGAVGGRTPSWSRDGNWVYFSSPGPSFGSMLGLWKVRREGGTPVMVTATGGWFPTESHDGKSVYFFRENPVDGTSLWKVPVEGGMPSQVLPSVSQYNFEVMDDGIYFIPLQAAGAKACLRFLSFATSAVSTVATLPGKIAVGLAISPDKRWALYCTADGSGGDLMLVDNFR